MQVACEDAADIGTCDHVGEALLVAQFENVEERQMRWDRRVVHRDQRPERGGSRELLPKPAELALVEVAVMPARH